jgi:DNA invertase Pin-like site-specific DNA recombinase
MIEPPRANGYCRVSSDRQAASGLSLEAQDTQCLEYVERVLKPKGIELGRIFVEPAVSASKKMFLDRPRAKVLDSISREGDHIVIAKLDRAFRNQLDFAGRLEDWLDRGVHVHILNCGLDTSNPLGLALGKLLAGIMSCFAEMESFTHSQRVKDAYARARECGRHMGNAPMGFKSQRDKFGHCHLVRDEKQFAVMREIVEWHEGGASFYEIAKTLRARDRQWLKMSKKKRFLELVEWNRWRVKRAYEHMKKLEREGYPDDIWKRGSP